MLADQVGDAVGQDPGLARAGTGDDQQRTVGVDDGVELVGVQAVDHSHGGAILRLGCSRTRAITPAFTKRVPFGAPSPVRVS